MAQLRYLIIPADSEFQVASVVDDKGKPVSSSWTFLLCVEHVIDTDPRFNNNGPGIRTAKNILDEFRGKKVGSVCVFDEADWRFLHDVFENPAHGYTPSLSRKLSDGTVEEVPAPGRYFYNYLAAVSDEATKKKPLPPEPLMPEPMEAALALPEEAQVAVA